MVGFAEKEGFKSGMKERVGDRKLIIISITVSGINDHNRDLGYLYLLLTLHGDMSSQPCYRSTQPCIPPGSLNRVPASAGVRAGMSALPDGR